MVSSSVTKGFPETRASIIDAGRRLMAAKGFSAVGLNEVLTDIGVPKGSFYHYFASKEAFGQALLEGYFEGYLAELDQTLGKPGADIAQRLLDYFENWRSTQSLQDCQGKCLAVKLGAEVADLSEPMRMALRQGTAGIVQRLSRAIETGAAEGSLTIERDAGALAEGLYQLWLGASVMAKITRNRQPFDVAMSSTKSILHLAN